MVSNGSARHLNLLGPVGRASGLRRDLRQACPYSGYERYRFEVPCEQEGDGYARLRVLFSEAQQSAGLIHQAMESMEPGEVCARAGEMTVAAALGWVEAPIGAAGHWVRLDRDGKVERYRILVSVVPKLDGLAYRGRGFRISGFSHHSGHVRVIRHRVRSVGVKQMSFWFWHGLRNGIQSTRYPWAPERRQVSLRGGPWRPSFPRRKKRRELRQLSGRCDRRRWRARGGGSSGMRMVPTLPLRRPESAPVGREL